LGDLLKLALRGLVIGHHTVRKSTHSRPRRHFLRQLSGCDFRQISPAGSIHKISVRPVDKGKKS
jgi:hypothetical protein